MKNLSAGSGLPNSRGPLTCRSPRSCLEHLSAALECCTFNSTVTPARPGRCQVRGSNCLLLPQTLKVPTITRHLPTYFSRHLPGYLSRYIVVAHSLSPPPHSLHAAIAFSTDSIRLCNQIQHNPTDYHLCNFFVESVAYTLPGNNHTLDRDKDRPASDPNPPPNNLDTTVQYQDIATQENENEDGCLR